MTHPFRHARLAALALGACLGLTACGDRAADEAAATDTAGGAVATAPAIGGAGTGSMEATDEPRNDSEILLVVSQANELEVSSSNLAVKSASDAQVRAFARQMVAEHAALQKEGRKVGEALGVEGGATGASPDDMDDSREALDDLKDRKGADFDKAYMDLQVKAHERTLGELRSFEQRAQNAELRQMITRAIPKVEAHLQKAQQLRQQLDG